MRQRIFKPSNPTVRQIVECISIVEATDSDPVNDWMALFPNATSHLGISLSGGLLRFSRGSGEKILGTAQCRTILLERNCDLRMLTVQFTPFGLHVLSGIPMTELHDDFVTHDILFSASEQEELTDRVRSAESELDAFAAVERFISHRTNPGNLDARVPFAVSLVKNDHLWSMDDLSKAVCLSPRGFRKLFRTHTGLSPNHYKKVIRFNKASRQMAREPARSLTDIAYSHGYYDQAHFIKDFRTMAGITPSQFMKQKATSADFYNFNMAEMGNFELSAENDSAF